MEIKNKWATVRSVSSGRVTLDFNHPLSGKTLHYVIHVMSTVEDPKEQIEALLRLHNITGDVSPHENGFKVKITGLKKGTAKRTENILKKEISTYLSHITVTITRN